MSGPSVTVVLPVRNGAGLVDGCLDLLLPQASAAGAELVVVDDGSTDGTADLLAARDGDGDGDGVLRVLRSPGAGGPYAARNLGWRAGTGEVVVFVDVRCRPAPGWLEAIVAGAVRDGTAVAGAGYVPMPGDSLAAQVVLDHPGFIGEWPLDDPDLPYLPGGNMAVRRAVLASLGGFRDVVSGGDMMLCWDALLAGLGEVALVPGSEMPWLPRDLVRDLVRQKARYGRHRLENLLPYRDHGIEAPVPGTFPLAVHLWRLPRLLRALGGRRRLRVAAAITACEYAYQRAYRTSYLAHARRGLVPPPRPRRAVLTDRLPGRHGRRSPPAA